MKPAFEPVASRNTDQPLDEDFSISHTGRRSNALYDVRHVRVILIMDARSIHRFIQTLADVNFMTVLQLSVYDVDEYEALLEGFPIDGVKVRVLKETPVLDGIVEAVGVEMARERSRRKRPSRKRVRDLGRPPAARGKG